MSVDEMRAGVAGWDLLKHSFYRRWTSGQLSLAELQDYACQYSFVVAAMPRWLAEASAADPTNRPTLEVHAREEAAHVEMWADFAGAVGVGRQHLATAEPNGATRRLLELGDDLVARDLGAAAVWALEVQTPRVSIEKLAALGQYGVGPGSGTRYFEVHRTMDMRHSQELAGIVAETTAAAEAAAAADAMSEALWSILTSVEAEVALA
jgi:pyrroloquinoline-quinone synthase